MIIKAKDVRMGQEFIVLDKNGELDPSQHCFRIEGYEINLKCISAVNLKYAEAVWHVLKEDYVAVEDDSF